MFLNGPPGNGKTSIGSLLHSAFQGELWIPHCIGIDNQMIRVFDPESHQLADGGWSFDHCRCPSCRGACGNPGSLADARNAIEEILKGSATIDAIAANNVTAKWPIYDMFPAVGQEKCVTPQPY